MKTRIITGTILAIVLAALIWFGEGELEFLFSGFCVLLATLASYEFTKMRRHGKSFRWFDYLAVINTALFALFAIFFLGSSDFFLYIFSGILVVVLINSILFVSIRDYQREDFSNQLLTLLYCSLGFIGFAYIRKIDVLLIVYLFAVSMLTDVFAYFIGIKFGKHRLAVHISPKKSIEGAIGGLVIGSVVAAVFANHFDLFDTGFVFVLFISIFLSAISQIGDLIASKFKREVDIKDYSNLLPGHGGILDRFDSSMFAGIFLMLFAMIL